MLPSRICHLTPLALCLALPAMASSTTLSGHLIDERGRPVQGGEVRLFNPVAGYRQTCQSDSQGRFVFRNIPCNDYQIEALAPGMIRLRRNVELRTTLPTELGLTLRPQGAVVVVEEQVSLVEGHPSSHLDIDKSAIQRTPAPVQSRAMEAILLSTPGFIADENGRFHFRGSHGQATYVIDGIPLSDQLHATFSNSLDPAQVESMEVITGGISAEYGGKPVAVINMTTKSGLGTPGGFAGDFSLGASRFRTRELAAGLRGCTDSFGYFITGAASESNRFLDPVNFENLHNHGGTGRIYSRFDWILTDQDALRASISGGRTRRDVANLSSQEAVGVDQRITTTDFNANLTWIHAFSTTLHLETALYHRRATSNLDPTAALAEGFPEGGSDTPVWASQDRSLGTWGMQTIATWRLQGDSTLKAGLQYQASPIQEHFRFAITDQGLVTDSTEPLYAYTPAGGGHIFAFQDRIKPTLASAFIQSDLHLGQWLIAAGLRYDRYTLRGDASQQLQPRLGASWRLQTGTILRASYDKLMITRENENLALSTSQKAWDLGPSASSPVPPLRPEIQDSYAVGIEQQVGQYGRIMLEYWAKDSKNAGDNEQFVNTGILFPISAAKGTFRGWNTRMDLVPINGFSGYLSLGRTRAVFQAPMVGGLLLESPEVEPGVRFLIDHDQKLAGQFGLRYEIHGFSAHIQGRYDSGLVAGDPAEAAGNPDLEFGKRYVRQDSEGTWRIKSRTVWNLGASQSFLLGGNRKLTLSADLLNLFDEKGLYNFLSVFGGTHVIPPRTWAFRAKYAF